MKKSPLRAPKKGLKRKTPLRGKGLTSQGTSLSKVSKRQSKRNYAYNKTRESRAVTRCEISYLIGCDTSSSGGTHHIFGRIGDLISDPRNLIVLCLDSHEKHDDVLVSAAIFWHKGQEPGWYEWALARLDKHFTFYIHEIYFPVLSKVGTISKVVWGDIWLRVSELRPKKKIT